MKKIILFIVLPMSFGANIFAREKPPTAKVLNVTDEYFGVKIVAPYRWLEDLKSKETQDWMKTQAVYADNYLQKLPMRDELYKRLKEVSSARTAAAKTAKNGTWRASKKPSRTPGKTLSPAPNF